MTFQGIPNETSYPLEDVNESGGNLIAGANQSAWRMSGSKDETIAGRGGSAGAWTGHSTFENDGSGNLGHLSVLDRLAGLVGPVQHSVNEHRMAVFRT